MTHTKGPWFFGIRGDDYEPIEKPFNYKGSGFSENPIIFAKDGTEIVGCDEYYIFNSEADARLIAAAPDLLEALMEANAELEYLNDPKGYVSIRQEKIMDKARAAIAKATGEQS